MGNLLSCCLSKELPTISVNISCCKSHIDEPDGVEDESQYDSCRSIELRQNSVHNESDKEQE